MVSTVSNRTDILPALSLTCAILLGSAAMLTTTVAQAEIRFEERGERFSLDVRDEPIADVMDALAEKFDLAIDGYPEHWSDEPMNFSATGDLERVLSALLRDTSHVFEYHTDLETRETRIASLKLLNEGEEGFIASNPVLSADGTTANVGPDGQNQTRRRQPGTLADRANPDGLGSGLSGDIATGAGDGNGAGSNNAPAPVASSSAAASGLSQTLAARARQASATSTTGAASASTNSGIVTEPGVPNAEMQALTQKALQDVKGLAEALRAAEGK